MKKPRYKHLTWGASKRDVFQCLMCAHDFPTEEAVLRHLGAHEDRIRLEETSVSCILVTSRPLLLPFAIRSWAFQSWEQKELIIVVDDPDLLSLIPDHPDIHGIVAPENQRSIGAKRNLACAKATGSLIAHWDDDDLRSPFYLEEMVTGVIRKKAILGGCPLPRFQDEEGQVWEFSSKSPYLAGASLIYLRSLWEIHRFEDVQVGEDWRFLASIFPGSLQEDPRIYRAPSTHLRCRIHSGNTSRKMPQTQEDYRPLAEAPWPLPEREKIAMGLLTWNTARISVEALQALLLEADRLRLLGYTPEILVTDNGSTDGTPDQLLSLTETSDAGLGIEVSGIFNRLNVGNSIARNQMIDQARTRGAKYLLFTDGDLEIIPWSVPCLISYLETHPSDGCAGLYSGGQTKIREEATPILHSVYAMKEERSQPVTWTQYGLFRMSIFEAVRFDSSGPFGGPGWGFEDNDLYFQMRQQEIGSVCFVGATYLHRNKHSSIALLWQSGKDPNSLFEARRQQLIKKWEGVPIINAELNQLLGVSMPC